MRHLLSGLSWATLTAALSPVTSTHPPLPRGEVCSPRGPSEAMVMGAEAALAHRRGTSVTPTLSSRCHLPSLAPAQPRLWGQGSSRAEGGLTQWSPLGRTSRWAGPSHASLSHRPQGGDARGVRLVPRSTSRRQTSTVPRFTPRWEAGCPAWLDTSCRHALGCWGEAASTSRYTGPCTHRSQRVCACTHTATAHLGVPGVGAAKAGQPITPRAEIRVL